MNKNLKLFLGLSLMSVLSVVLFSAKDNMASAADAGYGYGYGYSVTSAGGTYSSSPVNTVLSGGQVVSVVDLLNNTAPVVTTPGTKTPIIVNLSTNGSTNYGYSTTTTDLDNGDAKFVLPNTGVAN